MMVKIENTVAPRLLRICIIGFELWFAVPVNDAIRMRALCCLRIYTYCFVL